MRNFAIRMTSAAALSLLAIIGVAINNPAVAGGMPGSF